MVRPRHVRHRQLSDMKSTSRLIRWLTAQGVRLSITAAAVWQQLLSGKSYLDIERSAPAPALAVPVNTVLPVVTGIARVGQLLTTSDGSWTANPAPAFTYQWQRGTANIAGATSKTYTLVAGDAGNTVRCVVKATNSQGNASATSANTASVVATPANTALPSITGTAQVGQLLTVSNGTWTGTPAPTYTYQWKRAGANITNATASTYTVVSADIGSAITCTVTGTNSAGNSSATSAATTAVIA